MFLPILEEVDLMPFKEEMVDTPAEEAVDPVDLDVDMGLDEDYIFEEQDEAKIPSVLLEMIVLPLPSNIISVEVKQSIQSLIGVKESFEKAKQMMLWRG